MNIIHITVTCEGGAGKAALRLHEGLRASGITSNMLILYGSHKEARPDTVKFSQRRNIFGRCHNRFRSGFIKRELNKYRQTISSDKGIFSDDRSAYDIGSHPLIKDADIITLHWVAGMIDIKKFFSLLRKPVVWSLSDMNPFTGGCHYSDGCRGYERGCGFCPNLGSKNPCDLSRRIFIRKQSSYKGRDMHIVSPSRYFVNYIKRSLLFRDMPHDVIPIGISDTTFVRRDKYHSRQLLSLPQDKFIILFGCQYRAKVKGFERLIEALKIVQEKTDISKIVLALFGNHGYCNDRELKVKVCDLGRINDEGTLSYVYSSSDVLVMPSLEESFGLMCLEAMACGVPVVGSEVGAMPELIVPYETGFLTEAGSAEDLAQKIELMLSDPSACQSMGENARKRIEKSHTIGIEARRYIDLYRSILKNRDKNL
jgi:glycosyltransferase involved in cell wall biosynthesis